MLLRCLLLALHVPAAAVEGGTSALRQCLIEASPPAHAASAGPLLAGGQRANTGTAPTRRSLQCGCALRRLCALRACLPGHQALDPRACRLVKAGLLPERYAGRLAKLSAWGEFVGYLGSITLSLLRIALLLEREVALAAELQRQRALAERQKRKQVGRLACRSCAQHPREGAPLQHRLLWLRATSRLACRRCSLRTAACRP